jgi:hypothetical protein
LTDPARQFDRHGVGEAPATAAQGLDQLCDSSAIGWIEFFQLGLAVADEPAHRFDLFV